MNVKRVLGTEQVYEFEDGEIVPFWDKAKYKEKLLEKIDGKNEEVRIPHLRVEPIKTEEPEIKKRGRRKLQ
jgi:hypothetical protein